MGKFREWMNNHSAVMTIAAVLLLLAALGVIVYTQRTPTYSTMAMPVWFYDLGTKQPFVGQQKEIPPIDTASGANMGVRLHIYSCSDCNDESSRKPLYLEKLNDAAKQARLNRTSYDDPDGSGGYLVAVYKKDQAPDKWYNLSTPQGSQIAEASQTLCPKGLEQLQECFPDKDQK